MSIVLGTTPPGPACFDGILTANRILLSLSMQAALGGIDEFYRAQASEINAQAGAAGALTSAASVTVQISAHQEVQRWQSYRAVHFSNALQGAMVLFNTVDLALKAYSRAQHGIDKGWLVCDPLFNANGRLVLGTTRDHTNVSLLELVRALCNHFRHREEWLARSSPTKQDQANIDRLSAAGISALAETAFADMLQLIGHRTWLDFEQELTAAVARLP